MTAYRPQPRQVAARGYCGMEYGPKTPADLVSVGRPVLAVGKRVWCEVCGRPRLITASAWGGEISRSYEADVAHGRCHASVWPQFVAFSDQVRANGSEGAVA